MANSAGGNRLLDLVPQAEIRTIEACLTEIEVETHAVLFPGDAEHSIEFVYFPISCVVSMLTVMSDGSAVEAGTIGREGVAGIQVAFGADGVIERCIGQVAGTALRMPVADFRAAYLDAPGFRAVMNRFNLAYLTFLTQSVACNRLHNLTERFARWILLTHDRVGRTNFELTHEFLALMLGVRRPGVSVTAATLQTAGLISYSRGRVVVQDRAGLEEAACECYRITTDEYERLFREPLPIDLA